MYSVGICHGKIPVRVVYSCYIIRAAFGAVRINGSVIKDSKDVG